MAKYYRTQLPSDTVSAQPPVGPLQGGELALKSRVESLFRAQDRVPALGRNIVLTQSLSGYRSFLASATEPVYSGTRTHPAPELARVVARGRFLLTPGSMLRLSALVMPSGGTQSWEVPEPEINGHYPGPVFGQLRLDLTWYDPDLAIIANTTHTLDLPSSTMVGGSYPTSEDFWRQVRAVQTDILSPIDLADTAELRDCCRQGFVEAVLYHVGAVRVVDACLHEVPVALALEAEDDAGQWVGHNYSTVAGAGTWPTADWPYDRLDDSGVDGDPRIGTQHTMDVHHAAYDRLGTVLFYWTAYQESTSTGQLTHTFGASGNNTTYTEPYTFVTPVTGTWYTMPIGTPAVTATSSYVDTRRGWSLASASYGRRQNENADGIMDTNGSVPVVIVVYAASSVASTNGTLRVQADDYSYIDVDLNLLGTSPAARVAYGHLRCGATPGYPSVVQAFVRRTSGTGSIRLYSVTVYRSGAFAQAT